MRTQPSASREAALAGNRGGRHLDHGLAASRAVRTQPRSPQSVPATQSSALSQRPEQQRQDRGHQQQLLAAPRDLDTTQVPLTWPHLGRTPLDPAPSGPFPPNHGPRRASNIGAGGVTRAAPPGLAGHVAPPRSQVGLRMAQILRGFEKPVRCRSAWF